MSPSLAPIKLLVGASLLVKLLLRISLFRLLDVTVSIDNGIIELISFHAAAFARIALDSEHLAVDNSSHYAHMVASAVRFPVKEYKVAGFRSLARLDPPASVRKSVRAVRHIRELRSLFFINKSDLVAAPRCKAGAP